MRLRSRGSRPISPLILPAGGVGHAPADGLVFALQVARGEGGGEAGMGEFGFRDDHDAGRVLVQPVHDAGAALAADAGQALAAMGDEGVDQRAVRIAGGGVDDQAGRLVQHQQIGVLIEYRERQVLAERGCGFGCRGAKLVGGAGLHGFRDIGGDVAVASQQAFQDHALDAGARDGADALSQEFVEPGAGILWCGDGTEFRERGCRINHGRICGG